MDYEKAYKESFEAAKGLHEAGNALTKKQMEIVFPQLAESEDERIRKELVALFIEVRNREGNEGYWHDLKVADILAYLERQKINTEGDFARGYDCGYEACLNSHGAEWFEKQKEQKEIQLMGGDTDTYFDDLRMTTKPLTSREWFDEGIKYAQRVQKEQKPAEWRPQPESLEALMYAIEGKLEMIKPTSYLSRRLEDLYEGLVNTYNIDESFLIKLPKTAYSAEDIEELKALKDKIDASMDEKPANATQTIANENANENANAEWSEEDENMMNNILRVLSAFMGTVECESNPSLSTSYPTYLREINWLKALRPKSHWKPSEEQMKALLGAEGISRASGYPENEKVLASLYEELKKL